MKRETRVELVGQQKKERKDSFRSNVGSGQLGSLVVLFAEEAPDALNKWFGLFGRVSFVSVAVLTNAQLPDLEGVDFDDVDEGAVVGDRDVVRQLQALVGHVEGARQLVWFQVDDVTLSVNASFH